MSVKGKVVVVTGASSGIGRATALLLARRRATVILAARRSGALAELATECVRLGGQALAVPTDVSDPDAVEALARQTVARFGRIDVWINNASVGLFAPFLDIPLADFQRVMDVNAGGYVHGCRAALRQMTARGRGSIINVASIAAEVPLPYAAPYNMAKAAVRALGSTLRAELTLQKHKHIHVSTVLPPTIDTPFFQHSANYSGRAVRAMPPVYEPEAVARAIVSLIDKPRNEIVVGSIARRMVKQHRRTPDAIEAQMAVQADHLQLSRHRDAPLTAGTLDSPPPDGEARTRGGWHGRRAHGGRKVLGAVLTSAGAIYLLKRLSRV